MADTEKLRDMLDNMIKDQSEDAEVNFHGYLSGKMKETIHGVTADDDVVTDDSKDNEE